MSFNNFIPVATATELQKDLTEAWVFAANTNRNYEGLVKKAGDSVRILNVGKPTLTTATDGKTPDVPALEDVSGSAQTMPILHTVSFNFGVPDIDKAQSEANGELAAYMQETKDELASEMDAYIASLAADSNVEQLIKTTAVSKSNILEYLDSALLKLLNNKVSRGTKITVTAPPWFNMLLKQAYVELDTNNSDILKNGVIGKYNSMNIQESLNVYNNGTYDCIQVKTDRAIAFANPLMHMEPYRAITAGTNGKFEDAVAGYALYDAKVVRPKEIITLQVKAA